MHPFFQKQVGNSSSAEDSTALPLLTLLATAAWLEGRKSRDQQLSTSFPSLNSNHCESRALACNVIARALGRCRICSQAASSSPDPQRICQRLPCFRG